MTDDQIRSLVRAAIQKHLGASPTAVSPEAPPAPRPATTAAAVSLSFSRYVLPRADDDTMCIIEPAVGCNHCGYCQCHGH